MSEAPKDTIDRLIDANSERISALNATSETDRLRAKLAALQAARTAREESPEAVTEKLLEQIEREEREAATAAAIKAAEEKHGKLGVGIGAVKTRLGVVIIKRPHAASYRKFQDLVDAKMIDVEQFVRPCVVHPDLTAFDRLLEELPGVLALCAKVAGMLAGTASNELMGKS